MGKDVRTTLTALGGAAAGYFALIVLANAEDWQYYTIRSFVTGRSDMSDIVAHPADRWVPPALLAVFVAGGVIASLSLAGLYVSLAGLLRPRAE